MSRIRDIANILSGVSTDMATDAEVTSSIASHAAAADPHADRAFTTTSISTHSSAADPHTGYMLESTLTTAGDIIYATGANTPSRLGIGANGTYLTSNGSAPSWGTISSGGMTLLSTTTLSTTTTTVSSINTSYKHLFFLIRGIGASSNTLSFRTNGITTTNYYCNTQTIGNGFAFSAGWSNGATEASFNGNVSTNSNNAAFGWIYDYSNAAVPFKISTATLYNDGNDKWQEVRWVNRGLGTNAINSLTVFSPTSGALSGTLLIYGVN